MLRFHPKTGCDPGEDGDPHAGDMGTQTSLEAAGVLGGDGDKT